MSNILVTGGAGYIGSHTIVELLANGHNVVVVDSLANSSNEAVKRVEKITGKTIPFYEADICSVPSLEPIFEQNDIEAVIHFAGLKAVGESVEQPMHYYHNNLVSTLSLLDVMSRYKVKKLVFSSSATVYGDPDELPLTESSRTGSGITNPYGWTKYMIEQMLRDVAAADADLEVTILRYFNPIGAHESGLIGEDPNGIPNNLLPRVLQAATGKLEMLGVFGDNYNTPDGTAIRDYIHVIDLARGHIAALEHLRPGCEVYNLGTGKGTTVLQLIHSFEQASGMVVPYEIKPRRPGDVESCYADCSKAEKELGWKATLTIDQACADAWKWQSQNPEGYLG